MWIPPVGSCCQSVFRMDESLTKAGVYHFGCLAEINKDCSKFTQLDVFLREHYVHMMYIKYLNSKAKVYMCHFINSRHKSQKCVVFVGDPLLGSLSWWCVWIRFGLPSTPTWTAPQSSLTQTCNSRLGPGQGSHLSAHISSKDKRWKCIGMHHKIVRGEDRHYALCMIDMVDFLTI